jgi:uncharacterized spore protein YtfJ
MSPDDVGQGEAMDAKEAFNAARESLSVKRVFGEPYEEEGLTVIPAAVLSGGAGAGSGHDEKGQEGEGGGYGVSGRPAGAYVVKGGEVRWLPAVDVNRLVAVAGAVLVALVLMRPRMAKARRDAGGATPVTG